MQVTISYCSFSLLKMIVQGSAVICSWSYQIQYATVGTKKYHLFNLNFKIKLKAEWRKIMVLFLTHSAFVLQSTPNTQLCCTFCMSALYN